MLEPTPLTFTTDEGFGHRARIGLIVLETDQTLEMEFRQINIDGVAWYHSRIPNAAEVTPATLTAMEAQLPKAAALLPAGFEFDAIGYGCTSAATFIGEQGVREAIHQAHPAIPCTNPISAAIDAFTALDAKRIAVLTPYSAEVTAPVVDLFERRGLIVTALGSFLESDDFTVARISEQSVADGVRQIAGGAQFDAVFVSCTSVRLFGVVDELEAESGRPIVSSNLALAWRLLRLAGIDDHIDGLGTLLANH